MSAFRWIRFSRIGLVLTRGDPALEHDSESVQCRLVATVLTRQTNPAISECSAPRTCSTVRICGKHWSMR